MKKTCSVLAGLFLTLLTFTGFAQDAIPTISYPKEEVKGFYLGGHASTNGWGFSAKYSFNKWLSLKTGYENLSAPFDFTFEEYGISYQANVDYKTGGILALADFNYSRNLYLSTGIVFNSFNPKMDGYALSDLKYGDINIPAEDIGTFAIEIKPGLKASPYIGAGVNSYLGKAKRFVVNFETGFYYMGAPDISITADGLLAPTADEAHEQEAYLENQFDAYTIYPVVKLNLAFRIF